METSINKGASVWGLYQPRILTTPRALSCLNVWIANLTFVFTRTINKVLVTLTKRNLPTTIDFLKYMCHDLK
jgi:hypothetical protein